MNRLKLLCPRSRWLRGRDNDYEDMDGYFECLSLPLMEQSVKIKNKYLGVLTNPVAPFLTFENWELYPVRLKLRWLRGQTNFELWNQITSRKQKKTFLMLFLSFSFRSQLKCVKQKIVCRRSRTTALLIFSSLSYITIFSCISCTKKFQWWELKIITTGDKQRFVANRQRCWAFSTTAASMWPY